MAGSKTVVPKFSSFRAPAKEQKNEDVDIRRQHSGRSLERRENREKSKDRITSRDHHEKRRPTIEGGKAHRTTNPAIEISEVFKIDRKGDTQNLQYGRPHRYSIPGYRRAGVGYVLGLDRSARIERNDEDELIVAKRYAAARDKPNYESLRWRDARKLRLIRADESEKTFEPDQDFIHTGRAKKRRRIETEPSKVSSDVPDVPDYRSLDIEAQSTGPLDDSDVEYATSSSSDHNDDEYDERVKHDNARLTRLTLEHPNKANVWRDLIVHQEKMHFLGRGRKSNSSMDQDRRTLGDIRSTIYEAAIRSVAHEDDRLQLIEEHMEEVTELWEIRRLVDRWRQLLENYGHSTTLWKRYIDFVQANFADFRFERCRDAYLKCLEILSGNAKRQMQHTSKVELVHDALIHMFTRFTTMVREAGYSELAVALWQAALEFIILPPQSLLHKSVEERLNTFEEFWDSEAPRIGDVDAVGWHSYDEAGQGIPPGLDTRTVEPTATSDLFSMFAEAERAASVSMREPGRTADELGENDPYHVVLFSDIRQMLTLLPEDTPALHLIQGYLSFVGLAPIADGDEKLSKLLSLDPFLQNRTSHPYWDAKQVISRTGNTSNSRDTDDDQTRIQASRNVASHQSVAGPYHIQTTGTLFKGLQLESISLDNPGWTQRTLDLLTEVLPHEDRLAERYIALSVRLQKSGKALTKADKLAKKLLKARPDSLRLYNAYGIIEARGGKPSANSVFAATLAKCISLPEDAQPASILVWRTWVWEALQSGDTPLAHRILHSIGRASLDLTSISEVRPGPESMLRSSRTLIEIREQALSTGRPQHAVFAEECLALLHYLKAEQTTSVEAALDLYRQAEARFRERRLEGSTAHESLHQARADLMSYHIAGSRNYKPAIIRDALQESVQLFPSNTMILSAFAANETRFRLDDRVRSVTASALSRRGGGKPETIATHAFAIMTEVQRMQQNTGTKHAVRAAFERAIESRTGRHCPALWTSYLHFELGVADGDLEEAKKVFFKGLTKLPWCKSFMMEAFHERFRTHLGKEQLMRVYNVMEEKELRIFTDLGGLQDKYRLS